MTDRDKVYSIANIPVFRQARGSVPVVLHVPHASKILPQPLIEQCHFMRDFNIEAELMADSATNLLARNFIAPMFKRKFGGTPYIFESLISRCLVDMERFDSDKEEMNAVGMGVVYEKAHDLTPLYASAMPDGIIALRKRMYRAYSQDFSKLCEHVLATYGKLIILDIHSYSLEPLPYELHKDKARPLLCLGADSPDALAIANAIAEDNTGVCKVNEPFSGSYTPLSLWKDERVMSIMLEHRKDGYDLATGEPSELVADIYLQILDNLQKWYNNH